MTTPSPGAGPAPGAPLQAAIFDLDGLLVDTEPLWHDAEVEVLGALGVPLVREQTRTTKGMVVDEVVQFWFERYPWVGPGPDAVTEAVVDAVTALATERAALRPGAASVVAHARRLGLAVGVASSSRLAYVRAVLERVGLAEAMDVLRSAETEPFGKPHPGVFLAAAGDLGAAPPRCVVFEDAPAGVLAAKAARMRCVAVPEPADRGRPEIALADVVLTTLEEMDADRWAELGSPAATVL